MISEKKYFKMFRNTFFVNLITLNFETKYKKDKMFIHKYKYLCNRMGVQIGWKNLATLMYC